MDEMFKGVVTQRQSPVARALELVWCLIAWIQQLPELVQLLDSGAAQVGAAAPHLLPESFICLARPHQFEL